MSKSQVLVAWCVAAKERDGFTCQCCGSVEHLVAHHKKDVYDYPDLSFDLDNGVTLCRTCHYVAHQMIKPFASCLPRAVTQVNGHYTWRVASLLESK